MVQNDTQNLYAEIARLRDELAQARQTIHALTEKLDAALDGTGLCLWQGLPQTGELQVFNLQNFQPGDMAPHFDLWYAKLHPDDRDTTVAKYYDHLDGKTPRYEAEYRTLGSDGQVTWLWDLGRVVERDAEGRALRIMGAHFDITQRKTAEADIARLAHVDPLTGLENRRMMLERIRSEQGHTDADIGVMTLAMLDVDHFKQINDTYGHEAGDQTLIAVGQCIQQAVREGDACARWGGEEFLLLLRRTRLEQARGVAERVLATIRHHQEIVGDARIGVTACIGLAEWREGESIENLLRRADAALLQAKRNGRDCLVCSE
ncbi:sensor domain-containing diguanylate cyclase [Paludibacterium sp.]|uniref:sensor domain-containing diguanylate cyclase n=1 Tax=Paludibacterium sp. TaxID=1917523 RepID=UPI0025CD2370|nr:sensor domain-containing diguanylate cyclase [Paludibacterium sp.]MBV8646141.1 sensor domain-containing diguanylate cyclase [Paludibacterium sp.]